MPQGMIVCGAGEIAQRILESLWEMMSQEKKYIIGTISNLDQPMTPALKGDRSMNLYMNHVTEDMIKEERAQVLEATQEDIRGLAGIVEAMMKAEQICVIGSEDKIEEAKDMFDTVTGF